MPILSVASLFTASFLHGYERYGFRNMLIFFLITFAVSLTFEALSIQTGFPFGLYYYDQLAGPRLFDVPLVIMFAYFSMAYLSWILSNILLNQYSTVIKGIQILTVPLIAAFIMTMWDLCMDPLSSTIGSLWVWKEKGPYYGVPVQNYLGWFLVVYIIFQLFSFYISKKDAQQPEQVDTFSRKTFWIQAIVLYAIQALFQILSPFTVSTNAEIYAPMALITVFTMVFVSLLSYLIVENNFSRSKIS